MLAGLQGTPRAHKNPWSRSQRSSERDRNTLQFEKRQTVDIDQMDQGDVALVAWDGRLADMEPLRCNRQGLVCLRAGQFDRQGPFESKLQAESRPEERTLKPPPTDAVKTRPAIWMLAGNWVGVRSRANSVRPCTVSRSLHSSIAPCNQSLPCQFTLPEAPRHQCPR